MDWIGMIAAALALALIVFKQQPSKQAPLDQEEEAAAPVPVRRMAAHGTKGKRAVRPSHKAARASAVQEKRRSEGGAAPLPQPKHSPREERRIPQGAPLHRGEENPERRPARVERVVGRLRHRRDLVIYQELMAPPKSLRSDR